ncbi:MAG TPA: hypothetical protein PK978_02455 [Paludibacter sp.]|nr:hypothetical protein [Paludibacter sp.]HOS45081.1 hypothetical protein [Paludibacter sp.]HPM08934.1 hypothetical protein [Paludibacter sp.]
MKNLFCILAIITSMMFTACEKEDVINHDTQKKENILVFKSIEEFDNTLAKVNAMTESERLEWEKQQGFKSFGTICDEFYETIEPEQFKSIEEVRTFVEKNNDKIEFYTSSDGEIYCVTKDFNNSKRYLMNENREYVIGSVIIKDEDNTQPHADLTSNSSFGQQKVPGIPVQSDDVIAQNKIGNDNYRMHIWIKTYNYYDSSIYMTFLRNELKLANFARWLAIWWKRTYSTEYRMTLKTTDVTYGLLVADTGPNIITRNIKSTYIFHSGNLFPLAGGPVNSSPRLVYYDIYARNGKGCLIDNTKTY